eukprot:112539-Rhodomonas_salina.2
MVSLPLAKILGSTRKLFPNCVAIVRQAQPAAHRGAKQHRAATEQWRHERAVGHRHLVSAPPSTPWFRAPQQEHRHPSCYFPNNTRRATTEVGRYLLERPKDVGAGDVRLIRGHQQLVRGACADTARERDRELVDSGPGDAIRGAVPAVLVVGDRRGLRRQVWVRDFVVRNVPQRHERVDHLPSRPPVPERIRGRHREAGDDAGCRRRQRCGRGYGRRCGVRGTRRDGEREHARRGGNMLLVEEVMVVVRDLSVHTRDEVLVRGSPAPDVDADLVGPAQDHCVVASVQPGANRVRRWRQPGLRIQTHNFHAEGWDAGDGVDQASAGGGAILVERIAQLEDVEVLEVRVAFGGGVVVGPADDVEVVGGVEHEASAPPSARLVPEHVHLLPGQRLALPALDALLADAKRERVRTRRLTFALSQIQKERKKIKHSKVDLATLQVGPERRDRVRPDAHPAKHEQLAVAPAS